MLRDVEGEHLETAERIVVSPAAGVFVTAGLPQRRVTAGTTIGFVRTGDASVPVTSPWAGDVVAVDAVDGERLTQYQRVAWLRCA